MTFMAILGLNIMLGMFVPYVMIYALVVKPILHKRRHGSRKKPVRKKKQREKESLASLIGAYTFGGMILCAIMGLAYLTWTWALPQWLDMPSAIVQQYEKKEGLITDVEHEWETGSAKSWGYSYVELDGERYKFESLDFDHVSYEEPVTFHVLKHSKYVVKVSDSEGHVVKHMFSPVSFFIKLLIYMLLTGIYYFKKRRKSSSAEERTRRGTIVKVSFHAITLLIIVVSSFFAMQLTALVVVLIVHFLMHYLQANGGVTANIA
ncbi:hypothetical protein [Paenibacillus soyae]|uniref:Uncharacterized protein n=1 Tax=Paenibacillus soyae TaxID=2969249 RepID=A0A9X2MXZ5_9BACL|nr:hypothetical protein [Paenibacillus soyae]MCR2807916.1 hypothetical protein [Paenibacillus soyae]